MVLYRRDLKALSYYIDDGEGKNEHLSLPSSTADARQEFEYFYDQQHHYDQQYHLDTGPIIDGANYVMYCYAYILQGIDKWIAQRKFSSTLNLKNLRQKLNGILAKENYFFADGDYYYRSKYVQYCRVGLKEGIHGRPAAYLVKFANTNKNVKIYIIFNGLHIDATSIMSLMAAGIPSNVPISIEVEAKNEIYAKEAIEEVKKIIKAKSDNAMANFQTQNTGGVDLNQINIKRTGKTINVQFDPAQLNELEQSDFKGFTPVITGFQYIQSPFPLLGINVAKKQEELAKV
jgi:phosphotransferase system HPr (HPr) family protein